MLDTVYTISGPWVGVIMVLSAIGLADVIFGCGKRTVAVWKWATADSDDLHYWPEHDTDRKDPS